MWNDANKFFKLLMQKVMSANNDIVIMIIAFSRLEPMSKIMRTSKREIFVRERLRRMNESNN